MTQRREDLPPAGLMPEINMSLLAAKDIAVMALVEIARTEGLARLDALEDRAVLGIKNQALEGFSIERDAAIIGTSLAMIGFIFNVARRRAADVHD
jgi:hypothetical protein